MKEEDRNNQTFQEDSIVSLMRLAGPREALPEDIKTRLEKSFKEELRLSRQRRRAKKIGAVSAIAAVLVVAVMLSLPKSEEPLQPGIASIVRMTGAVLLNGSGTAGDDITVGAQLNTNSDGRVLLALAGSATTVRLDYGTELVLQSESELLLESGSIYIDTGGALKQRLSHLKVTTEFADITDIGTQYLITATDESTVVAVREGIVRIVTGEQETESRALEDAAQQLSVSSTLLVNSQIIPKHGAEWSWIHNIAPSFDTDKRPLIEYLEWVSRETGKSLQFDSAESAQASHDSVLRGSLQGYSPEDALEFHLSTTDFESLESDDGILLISHKSNAE